MLTNGIVWSNWLMMLSYLRNLAVCSGPLVALGNWKFASYIFTWDEHSKIIFFLWVMLRNNILTKDKFKQKRFDKRRTMWFTWSEWECRSSLVQPCSSCICLTWRCLCFCSVKITRKCRRHLTWLGIGSDPFGLPNVNRCVVRGEGQRYVGQLKKSRNDSS
jgi:hypothetical protein